MKNKIFSIVLVMLVVVLGVIWNREQEYRAEVRRMDLVVEKLELEVQLLYIKALRLKEEMEFLNLLTYIKVRKENKTSAEEKKGVF